MKRPLFCILFLPLLTIACATYQERTAEFGRQCPLGNTTEITVTSDQSPKDFALETAARAALRDGYEKFTVVRGTPQGDTYIMLVRMIPNDDTSFISDAFTARDILLKS